jgi:hypothetical protein
MKDRTQRDRQGRRRAKMREAGYVLVQVWAHTDDKPRVIRYAAQLRKSREKPG